VAIIAVCAFLSYRRGFLRSLMGLVGAAVAFFAAYFYSSPAANWIYQKMLSDGITQAVKTSVETYGMESFDAFAQKLDLILEQLPAVIANVVNSELDAQSLEQWYQSIVAANSGNIAAALADNVIAPIITAMLQIVLFCLLFFVCSAVVKLLSGLLGGVRHLPAIGAFDGLLGGVFGAARGMLYVFVLAAVLLTLMRVTNDGLPFVTEAGARQTVLFGRFFDAVSKIGMPS
jgi:uncharacterized membrane protein required for colicin V production